LAVRTRSGDDLGSMTLNAFLERLTTEVASHGISVLEE